MAGIKRKSALAIKPNVGKSAFKPQTEGVLGKKRKLTLQPGRPAAGYQSLVKAADDGSGDGGVDVTLSDEDAIRFGPSAQERGEAETDSDPIVESDTTEQSGDDNAVSWPSDDDEYDDEYDEEAIKPLSAAAQDQAIEAKVSKAPNDEEDGISKRSSSVSDRIAGNQTVLVYRFA